MDCGHLISIIDADSVEQAINLNINDDDDDDDNDNNNNNNNKKENNNNKKENNNNKKENKEEKKDEHKENIGDIGVVGENTGVGGDPVKIHLYHKPTDILNEMVNNAFYETYPVYVRQTMMKKISKEDGYESGTISASTLANEAITNKIYKSIETISDHFPG